MKYKEINEHKVMNTLGLSQGLLGKSRKPGRDLSRKSIEKILSYYTDLNEIWLITGKGEMLNEAQQVNESRVEYGKKMTEAILQAQIEELRKMLTDQRDHIAELNREIGRLQAKQKQSE